MSTWSSLVKRLSGRGQQHCTECGVLLHEDRVEWVNGFPACRTHAECVFLDTVV